MGATVIVTRTLSPLATAWLRMLPPVLQDSPWIQGMLNAQAREMERLIGMAEDVAAGLIPTSANEYTLAIWEALLGLPVSPPGTTTEVRLGLVASRLIRGDGSGAEWERAMAAATNNSYRYTEHDSGDPAAPNYTLAINTALPPGVTIEALRTRVRSITPANLHFDLYGGQTYEQVRNTQANYTAVRSAYPNYDNMRYGVA